ncbi:MAG: hypothetical protein HYS98_07980 [Deltaproteobacteria bacterium]|nr:hypothetical protein [Deltaproteobacteria bacterium]
MIPARLGSQRFKKKNVALLDGRPLISYAICAAQQSEVFDKIILNSESDFFAPIAQRHGIEFYQRPISLGSSETQSDEVVYDFIQKHPCEVLAWVNSTSPLQTGSEVADVVRYFQEFHLDSLMTVKNEQVHCLYDQKPINFKIEERFSRTQDLKSIQALVYSVMMWRCEAFKRNYEKQGYGLLCGRVGYYPVSHKSSLIIKTENDFRMAEAYLQSQKNKNLIEYDLGAE